MTVPLVSLGSLGFLSYVCRTLRAVLLRPLHLRMVTSRIFVSATLVLSTSLLAMTGAHAFDFKTIGSAPAILYDAPSVKGGKLFIAPRGMPVEVVLTYGEWSKVRDASGELAWTESKLLSPRRNLVVRNNGAKVRGAADESSNAIMSAERGVLLELVDAQGVWAKVRHRDGLVGYVRSADVWGL